MERKTIIDVSKNANDNFNNILEIVTKVLNSAMAPFIEYLTFDTADQFLEFMQYDYNSLYTATVYGLLTMLANTYSEGLPISEILKIMPNAGFDDQTNRKRLERIHKKLLKRNLAHTRYLSAPEYTPRLLAFDALWYDVLCEYPMINRFLHEEEAIVSKKFFDELNLFYDKINMCKGYDRYHLFCKWETNSKFEMFYKILTLLKKEKRRLKLPDENVRYMLGKMQQLQVVPYHHYESKFILSCSTKNIEVFYEILGTNINEKYISSIVFGVDRLIKYFIENPGVTINMIITLSFIINAVVFHLCEKIENELSLSDNKIGFKLIYDIQHCKTATDFFEKYLNTNSIVNFDKDCSKDITFTHFKRIYKIKPAK